MNNPTIEELLYHAKQAEENAASCEHLARLNDDYYWKDLFAYHSLSAQALNKWVDELKNEQTN
jgi:hypothetical protein